MTFRESGFRNYFSTVASPNSVSSYLSFLRSIDRAIGGLDEAVAERGAEGVWEWAQQASVAPFDKRRSDSRSILKRYLGYATGPVSEELLVSSEEVVGELTLEVGLFFELERNMQSAVRRSIGELESGLVVVDGGFERSVATGKIDILARDQSGKLTVIELKAGRCPAGALEQALGYADSVSAEDGEPVRAVLVAASFSDRQVAAAKRINDLKLYTYDYIVSFAEIGR